MPKKKRPAIKTAKAPLKEPEESEKENRVDHAVMSFQEKQLLFLAINGLPSEKFEDIINIIRQQKNIIQESPDVISIDFESLKPSILKELQSYVETYNSNMPSDPESKENLKVKRKTVKTKRNVLKSENKLKSGLKAANTENNKVDLKKSILELEKENYEGPPVKKPLDTRAFRRMIEEKQQSIEELQEEYEALKSANAAKSKDKHDDLNQVYLRLKAEAQATQASEPISVPNHPRLLSAWVQNILEQEVFCLEELLSFQKDKKKIAFEKKTELQEICEREQINESLADQTITFEDLLDDERFKAEIMECLHTKLIRRLRRISRNFYPSSVIKEENSEASNESFRKVKLKSMFSILKGLLIELRDTSVKPEEWEKSRLIEVDEHIPIDYLNILVKNRIVQYTDGHSSYVKIIS